MSSRKTFFFLSIWTVLAIGLTSCSDDGGGGVLRRSLAPTPNAFGKINDLMVVADSSLWTSPVGDTMDFYYGSPYLILPQPEPIFDLRHITPEGLSGAPVMQQLRTYVILADLSHEDSPTTRMVRNDIGEEKLRQAREEGFGSTIGRNKWAKNQLLVYLYGASREELAQGIISSFPVVAKRIREKDREQIDATAFFNGVNRGIMDTLQQRLGVQMRIPRDYFIAPLDDESALWLRKDIPEGSSNIFLKRVPYRNQSQLTKAGIKIIRDSMGLYVSSTAPNTYMKINDEDLPMFTEVTSLNGDYAIEARGIWEIANDFMGGPFVSYLIYDPQKQDLLYADAFLYAPGEDKRDLIQELEYVLSTIKY